MVHGPRQHIAIASSAWTLPRNDCNLINATKHAWTLINLLSRSVGYTVKSNACLASYNGDMILQIWDLIWPPKFSGVAAGLCSLVGQGTQLLHIIYDTYSAMELCCVQVYDYSMMGFCITNIRLGA